MERRNLRTHLDSVRLRLGTKVKTLHTSYRYRVSPDSAIGLYSYIFFTIYLPLPILLLSLNSDDRRTLRQLEHTH